MTVTSASLTPDAYTALLHNLAVVDSAKLKPVERLGFTFSSNDFWAYARVTTNKKTLLDLSWAGYEASNDAFEFAKPRAAVRLARNAVKNLDFQNHALTDEERSWASAKFARDWKKFERLQSHWWLRERYINMIGVVGDKAALSVLRDILTTVSPNGKLGDASDGRSVYFAINAVTRLTKMDVRETPVEEMDIEKTRTRVRDLIK